MPQFNTKNVIYIAFFTSLVSAFVMIALFVFMKPSEDDKPTPIADKLKNFILKEEEKADTDTSVLLMGYGGAGHSGGGLADMIMLLNIDSVTKQISLISIPRDTWVSLPLRSDSPAQNFKINHAYAIGNDDSGYPYKESQYVGKHGGGELSKYAVDQVTGIRPDYYAAIDFERFKSAIDALGGITVDVPVSFSDKYFPIPGNEELLCDFTNEYNAEINEKYSGFELEKLYECRYETLEFERGPTEMDGDTALKFIRSRHSDNHGGDFARGERAQAVIIAIKNKLLSLGGISKVDEFYEQFSKMIRTDIEEEEVLKLLTKYPDFSEYQYKKINLKDYLSDYTSNDGQYALIPKKGVNNFSEINQFIKIELGGEYYEK